MRVASIVLPLVLLAVFCTISANAVSAVDTTDLCKEGDRRICGWDIGICESGRTVCEGGNWTGCKGGVKPQDRDVCGNGLDDDCNGMADDNCFPWISMVLIGIGIFFIGLGLYYMQKGKGERIVREGVSKD